MENVKNEFVWEDMFDDKAFDPCDFCTAYENFQTCSDGATTSACNYCRFNIYLHLNLKVV